MTFDAPVTDNGLEGAPFYDLVVTTSDVNGDGHDDLAITAGLHGPLGLTPSRAHVVLDGRTGAVTG